MEKTSVVGELEKDVARDAEPVSLAAAGLEFLSARRTRPGGKAVHRNSWRTVPMISMRCICSECSISSAIAWSMRSASWRGAQGQFQFRRCAVESRARASCDRTLRRGHLKLSQCAGSCAGSSGNSLQSRQRLSRARSCRRRAVELRHVLAIAPTHVGALVNRGNTLLRLNQPAEAIASYDAALASLPGHPQILTNRGHALRRLDRPSEALVDFKAALGGRAGICRSAFRSRDDAAYDGRFRRGLEGNMNGAGKPAHLPGIGAQSQAAVVARRGADRRQDHSASRRAGFRRHHSVRPLCAAAGRAGRARSICEVQPELLPLLSQLDHAQGVIAKGEPLPAFDLHCPLLSLPLAFGTQPGTIPAGVPYLAATAERQAYWRDRLPPGRLRAGFVWSGSVVAQERRQPLDRASRLVFVV